MQLSDCLAVTPAGLLVYIGHKGELHLVIGGRDGQLLLKEMK